MDSPIKFSELLDIVTKDKTRLQIDHAFAPFAGKTFELIGRILEIGQSDLYFFPFAENTDVHVVFSQDLFFGRLLKFNKDDKVIIKATLESLNVSSIYSGYIFTLLSIAKTDLPLSKRTEKIQQIEEMITNPINVPIVDLPIKITEVDYKRLEAKQNGQLINKIVYQTAGGIWGYVLGNLLGVQINKLGFQFGFTKHFLFSFCMIIFGYFGGIVGMKILRYMEKSKGEWDDTVILKLSVWNLIHLVYPYLAAPFISILMSEDFSFGITMGYVTATIFYIMYLMRASETVQEKTGRGFKTDFGTIDEVKNVTYQNYTPIKYSKTIGFSHFICGLLMLIYLFVFK